MEERLLNHIWLLGRGFPFTAQVIHEVAHFFTAGARSVVGMYGTWFSCLSFEGVQSIFCLLDWQEG